MVEKHDVVVMGGGPAGSTCATRLAQMGHRVLLLEKETFPRFMVGESLLPALWEYWNKLGITERIDEIGYPVKQGVSFKVRETESEYLLRTDEYPECFYRPYTYHVDRAHFDKLLLDNAREKGVDAREECEVIEVLFEGNRATGLRFKDPERKTREVEAKVVVDATGRRTLLGRELGRVYPNPNLKKVSYYAHFEGADAPKNEDGTTYTAIHTADGGWIWFIALRDGIASVGVVLDARFVQSQDGGPEAIFDRAITDDPLIAEWLANATQTMRLKRISAVSYLSDSFVGDGFVIIGDAALFVDPIFSAGVTVAMRGGDLAADAISKGLALRDTSKAVLKEYEDRIRYPLEKYVKMVENWYTIMERKDRSNIFEWSRKAPALRERLVVLLSGGYDRVDLEALQSWSGDSALERLF